MNLNGLDLGAWITASGAVVLLTEYDEVTMVLIGHVVHPMREVRYGKDGRLVSCCFLPGESQTVDHEQKLHEGLHLKEKVDPDAALLAVSQEEWEESYIGDVPPSEDWVEITDPNHVLRAGIDYISENGLDWWTKIISHDSIMDVCTTFPRATFKFRCLRHHHPYFVPARRQDSAGAGIYDEMPPLVNTYADRTLNASRLLKDAVDEAKSVFDTPASIEVVPPTEYRFSICTADSDWNIRGTHFEWFDGFLVVYLRDDCVAWIRNAESCTRENSYPKPAAPAVTIDLLTPLGDSLERLLQVVMIREGGLIPYTDVIASTKACLERFKNLWKTVRGE